MSCSSRSILSLGGNFVNSGILSAGASATVLFKGRGAQSITGASSFDNLLKAGTDTLTLLSPITVTDSLNVLEGYVNTGPDTILFGPNATLNRTRAGGVVIGPHTIIGPGFASVSWSLLDNWNMVSVPLAVADYHKSAIYPGAVSNAFGYNSGYVTEPILQNGPGYWLKIASAHPITITGNLIQSESLNVSQNWNMVGSGSYPVAKSAIEAMGTTITSPFFGFASGGYFAADTLEPGYGYWVRVNQPGKLFLPGILPAIVPVAPIMKAGSEGVRPQLVKDAGGSGGPAVSSISVTDGLGRVRRLYFAARTYESPDLNEYVLPPPPPPGILDLRYQTNRTMELFAPKEKLIPLRLSSEVYPLDIQWENSAGHASLDIDGKQVELSGKGDLRLYQAARRIFLRLQAVAPHELPRVFALRQNHPNPFNPTTEIAYDVPGDARVRLTIYDALGREVKTLVDEDEGPGLKTVEWNSTNDMRVPVASGVYFYRLEARRLTGVGETFMNVKRMLLIR